MNNLVRVQRKNAAKEYSIKNGILQTISGTSYNGANPVLYTQQFKTIKVKKGIPWVRTSYKPHEIKRLSKPDQT